MGAHPACAYQPGHPVIQGAWGTGGPARPSAPAAGFVGTDDPAATSIPAAERLDLFFGDAGQLRLRLREARARAPGPGRAPVHHVDREAAAGLVRRSRGRGPMGGALRNACVFAIGGVLPLPPARAAALWLDPVLQGRALGVRAFERERVVFALPEAARIDYRVAMLGVGTAPFTFDLVFGTAIESLEVKDGSVALRYDAIPTRGQQHVTLWRGGAIFEPHPAGTLATEVVIFGTDISLPLLDGALRSQVEQALRARAINLTGFAFQLARQAPPPDLVPGG
jgi:hypothetical protein